MNRIYCDLNQENMMRYWLRRCFVASVLLVTQCVSAADPQQVAPDSLRQYWATLADIVQAAGSNKIDRAIDHANVENNPAFRTPDDRAKFRDGLVKLLTQIAKFQPRFESFDVIAIAPVSSQAFTVYGVGNSERGPMHLDFDCFFSKGRWHIQGIHFNIGWKRDKEMLSRTVFFDKPVVLRLDQAEVAVLR